MRLLSTAALLSFCLMSVAPAQAQDPPAGGGSPQAEGGMPVKPASAEARALAWVEKQGWKEGLDETRNAAVAIGVAAYDLNSRSSGLVRMNAFQKAAFRAKASLAKRVSARIATIVDEFKSVGASREDALGISPGSIDKIVNLSGMGAGADSPSTGFQVAVEVVVRAEICGLTAAQVFEGVSGDGSGELAVVMRLSEASMALARAAMDPKAAPPESEVPLVYDAWYAGASNDDLYSCLGVRIFRNSTSGNELCIVAFGQGDAFKDNAESRSIAKRIAETGADGALRQFVGELVIGNRILQTSSSYTELLADDAGGVFKDEARFIERATSAAAGLEFSGIDPKFRSVTPPEKRSVELCASKWSVSSANLANRFGKQMKDIGGSAGGSGRNSGKPGDSKTVPPQRLPTAPGGTPIQPRPKGPDTPEP